ncbi:MAG: carbohydrate ABC transporter permease [Actinobacteria bacterium]|nr:carbohydrate ABC transporter permease [Actinomycetota bacterium]
MIKKYDPFRSGKLRYVFLIISLIFAILMIIPFYWMFVNSILPNSALLQVPPPLIPKNTTFINFITIFQRYPIARWLLNSLFISGVTAGLGVYIGALAAYPLAKKRFPGSFFLFWLPIAFLTVPRATMILPLFVAMQKLNLINQYPALILPLIAAPLAIFLMKQMIQTVPDEIIDAARVDGCSELRIFHQIILPVVKPALGALLIFLFMQSWNDFIWQLIILRDPAKYTIPLGLTTFAKEYYIEYGYLMAAATVGALPVILFFMLFQRYFVSGITMGAVKE